MKKHFSEDEVVTAVTRLTRRRLTQFIEVDLIRPHQAVSGYVFHQATSRDWNCSVTCRTILTLMKPF